MTNTERRGNFVGLSALLALVAVPPLLGLAWHPLAGAVRLVILIGLPVSLWRYGRAVGIDRRAAVLVGIPLFGLFAVVPAIWRWAHHDVRTAHTALEPRWGRVAWTVAAVVGVGCWLGFAAATIRSM